MDELEALKQLAPELGEDMANGPVPNATLVYGILSLVLGAQRRRNPNAERLKHSLRYSQGEDRITLNVMHLAALDASDLEALRGFSQRILGVRFQFTSIKNDDPITYGHIIVDILHTQAARTPTLAPYTEPARRRPRVVNPDWSRSVVLEVDRALVMRVVDDVYNMQQLMPARMPMSIEAIEDTDHTQSVQASSRKRKPVDAVENDSDTSRSRVSLVGYCIHFVGVPSFNDNFLTHMAQKYSGRWLGATITFPYARKSDSALVPQQLMVSIGAEHVLAQASRPRAVCGAKRLCKKIYGQE